jgi:Family of unknown function (DUF5329)
MRQRTQGLVIFLLLETGITPALSGQSDSPPSERQKIEAIIQYVGAMNDTKFVRNGSAYDAKTAAIFLRRKWGANDAEVKTARDFIDKVASFSGTSGKPYMMRFKDGSEVKSRDFLLAVLDKIEKSKTEQTGADGLSTNVPPKNP